MSTTQDQQQFTVITTNNSEQNQNMGLNESYWHFFFCNTQYDAWMFTKVLQLFQLLNRH